MTLPKIKLSTLFPWLLLVAVILLLAYCNNRGEKLRQVWQDRAELADSLRKAGDQDGERLIINNKWYQAIMSMKAQQAQNATKKTDSIQRVARQQTAEIRQLYALLSEPWPVIMDTGGIRRQINENVAKECCQVAVRLADSFDSLQVTDSLKDLANMQQLDLATIQVDTLNLAIKREQRRYNILDSLNRRYQKDTNPRGSLWGGLRAAVGPVSSAGGYLKWQTPGGKEYGAGGGRMGGGWYGEVSIGTKFSFRRLR